MLCQLILDQLDDISVVMPDKSVAAEGDQVLGHLPGNGFRNEL